MSKATGAARLATALQKRMNAVSSYNSSVSLELGKITSSMGLKLDNFSQTIPKGDYMVCKSLKLPSVNTGSTEGHRHTVNLGQNTLSPGCRVLVGFASGEPVVIDVVVR